MRGMKLIAAAFAATVLPATVNDAAAASDPTGIWLNDTGRGAVEIKMCGSALCGHVVWVKDTSDSKGCGKQIIGDVASVGDGRWDNGWIYSPERGRRYNVEITPLANGTLRVTGYAGMKFLSKTMIWKRAPDNLEHCGTTEAKVEPTQQEPETKSSTASVSPSTSNAAVAAKSNETAAAPSPPPASAPGSPPNGDDHATSAAEPPAAHEPLAPSKDETHAPYPNQETAAADDDVPDIGKTLNGLGFGKVVSKSKSGKCKLDLPWVKMTIDCDR